MQIKKLMEPTAQSASKGLIPKVIHQTFETTDIQPRMHEAAMSWVTHNPDFTYRFHDNADRRAFIETHFAPEVLWAYEMIDHGAFRADLWRYCQLYIEGGVYADLDSVCQVPISDMLRSDDAFVVARAGNLGFALYNGFICAQAGLPFLKYAIDRSAQLIVQKKLPFDGYMMTGPGHLGRALNLFAGRAEESLYAYGVHEDAGLVYRILEKRRREGEARR